MHNPYIEEWEARGHAEDRRKCIANYGFAVPNDEAIQKLVELSPIIEMGAGIGYWASLVAEAGGQIEAFDKWLGVENSYSFKHREPWFPIQFGEPEMLKTHPAKTLFLCWPCYKKSFAHDCLKAFQGDTVVYIGEGMGGCTADDEFHQRLEEEWKEVGYVIIPRWERIHDVMTIHERK